MSDGTDGTLAEVFHAIDFGGDLTRYIEVHQITEPMDGVGLQVPRRVGVMNPLPLDVFEIHVIVGSKRVGPREILEQLDGCADGHLV